MRNFKTDASGCDDTEGFSAHWPLAVLNTATLKRGSEDAFGGAAIVNRECSPKSPQS
jgi:hypothetical protein